MASQRHCGFGTGLGADPIKARFAESYVRPGADVTGNVHESLVDP